jgi:uncharacterized glyoxalase superfamily protein PhnB
VIEQRLTMLTLGVDDFQRAVRFYEHGLGWKKSSASQDDVAFFQLGGIALALHPRKLLAEDALVPEGSRGFSGITLAHNVRTREEVATVLATAEKAGARILKHAQDTFWGGHHGYFEDPDGHVWETAWNPGFPLDEAGNVTVP